MSVHVTDPVPPEPGAATVQPVGHVIALNVVFGGVCWYKTALFTAFGPLFVMVSVYVMVPEGETTEVEAVWVKARSACAATGAGASNMQVDAASAKAPNDNGLRTRTATAARTRCIIRRKLARQKLNRESCAVCFPLA